MQNEIIVNQVLILAILVISGIFVTKLGIITDEIKNSIAELVFTITLPLLIFTTLGRLELSAEIIRNSGFVIILSFVSLLVLYLGGNLSAFALRLDERGRTIHLVHTMYGNIVFLGFPLLDALFPGGEGLLYASLFQLASNAIMWTSGIYILNKSNSSSVWSNLKHLINPNTISFLLGFILLVLPFKLPDILDTSLGGLGKTTIYLSMIYIGAMLAKIDFKGIFKHIYVYVISFNKLLLFPFLVLLLINFIISLFSWEMSMVAKAVVVLQTAMPCQATIVVLAKKFGQDDAHATENMFLSTVLSLITLPIVYWLIYYF